MSIELPKRMVTPLRRVQKPTFMKFSELINLSDDLLKTYFNFTSGLFIDDFEIMKQNFDKLEHIIKFKEFLTIYSRSYGALRFIEDNIKTDEYEINLALIDDFQNKDRSYIDANYFEKTEFTLPFSYVMWNPNMTENQNVACYYHKDNLNPFSTNLYNKVSLESLKEIRELACRLGELSKKSSKIDKVILVSDYLQNLVQFVDANNISHTQNGTYVTNSNGEIITPVQVGSPENVLKKHYGVCNGIAHATTMLLNNPEMNVNARSVYGNGHTWNIVQIGNKFYYVDNTWSISRNKDQYSESLKAKSFDSTYLLFGKNTAEKIGCHTSEVYTPIVEEGDISTEKIELSQKRLVNRAKFTDYNEPVFPSIKLK